MSPQAQELQLLLFGLSSGQSRGDTSDTYTTLQKSHCYLDLLCLSGTKWAVIGSFSSPHCKVRTAWLRGVLSNSIQFSRNIINISHSHSGHKLKWKKTQSVTYSRALELG